MDASCRLRSGKRSCGGAAATGDRGPVNHRAPTLRDIAQLAGIAQITASRILNGNPSGTPIAEETRKRVERIASELGYQPHASARAMRQSRTQQVGVVVANDPQNPLTNLPAYEYILGINAGLEPLGLVVSLVRRSDVDGHPERIRAFEERMFDAFVVISHLTRSDTARLRASRARVVWLDTDQDDPTGCLRRDERAAGEQAAGLLIARGRKRVLWPQRHTDEQAHYSHHEREAGARAACAAAGVDFVPLRLGKDFAFADSEMARFRKAASDPASGLLLCDPQLTRWALYQLAMAGLVPGRDLGVASCDCDHTLDLLWSGLSRIRVHREELGRRAAAMVAAAIAGNALPPSELVQPTVIAGTTA